MNRKRIIQIVTFLGGLYFFLEWLLPQSVLDAPFLGFEGISKYHENISDGFILISVMALGLGIINLLLVHGSKLLKRSKGSSYSFALLFGLFFMLIISFLDWRENLKIQDEVKPLQTMVKFAARIESDSELSVEEQEKYYPLEQRIDLLTNHSLLAVDKLANNLKALQAESKNSEELARLMIEEEQSIEQLRTVLPKIKDKTQFPYLVSLLSSLASQHLNISHKVYSSKTVPGLWKVLYDGLFVALGSAMFSILGVYIATAAFRAFRVKSLESALMMGAAVLVILGQIPYGLWISDSMPEIRNWLLTYPNAAAFRAIKLGAAIASLVLAYRMWFSIESEYK